MAKRKMTPAEIVIEVFGGVRATARALKLAPSSVSRWVTDRNGLVPQAQQYKILKIASRKQLKITPTDLIIGR